MKIAGIQKVSGIDFPGKLSTVVFTQGCNFRCQFCHNETLVIPSKFQTIIPEATIFEYLKNRIGKIEAVVVSGGEPTIQEGLIEFFRQVKELGYLTKLDTNGSNPGVLQALYERKLLDYVAMDVKHELNAGSYRDITCMETDIDQVRHSIELIINGEVDYEFRTTVVPHFHSPDSIMAIAKDLAGAKRFVLQEFVPWHAINRNLRNLDSMFIEENRNILNDLIAFCRRYIRDVQVRKA